MADLVLPAPPLVVVPVKGGGGFPVRRIVCMGRNYGAHVAEMGGDPKAQPPIFFSGTPEGVGPLARGGRAEGAVADRPPVAFAGV